MTLSMPVLALIIFVSAVFGGVVGIASTLKALDDVLKKRGLSTKGPLTTPIGPRIVPCTAPWWMAMGAGFN